MEDRELLHQLMHAAALGRRRRDGREDPGHGCRRGYGRILDQLSAAEGKNQREVALALDVRPQSVSEALARMEGQGLVRRETDPRDARGTLVYLTDVGEQRREDLIRDRGARAAALFAVLTPTEKETLYGLLTKLCAARAGEKENL